MEPEKCISCALRNKEKNICQLTGISIDPEEDFCSQHKFSLSFCDNCRKPLVNPIFTETLTLCDNCRLLLSSCAACDECNKCEFNTNPDPSPKYVMKTFRQGNSMAQVQVKNEERVEKFCHNCPCWIAEIPACGKDFNLACGNFASRFS